MKELFSRSGIIVLILLVCATFTLAQTEDRPVRITKVPQAEYSGEARGRMIEGWIKLRVTLLETGRVGDIFYVDESDAEKNLTKYGLLKNCYEAAKKVEFEPAVKEGKPVTVTKVLQYHFSLGRNPGFRGGRRP